jgi:hypothetical protein
MTFGGTNRLGKLGGKMLEEFIITMVLAILKQAIKNPAKATALRTALLEVRDEINALYPGA